jgi:hypothetical protein
MNSWMVTSGKIEIMKLVWVKAMRLVHVEKWYVFFFFFFFFFFLHSVRLSACLCTVRVRPLLKGSSWSPFIFWRIISYSPDNSVFCHSWDVVIPFLPSLLHFYDLSTRWRWVVSVMPGPFYPQGKSFWYPLDRRLGGLQSWSGHGSEEKNSQPLLEIEP